MKLFSYNSLDTPIHRLSGLTKLICFLIITCSVMYTYDIRVILIVLLFSAFVFKISGITFKQVKLMFIYVLVFLLTNACLSFIFSPEYGCSIYGTRHEILKLPFFAITQEQLFYQITKFFKYASVVPFGIIFILTTNPSEFASSINGAGVNYKAAYALSLTLRYFPDTQQKYQDICLAQQARGLDLSKKAKLSQRFKNALLIIFPLIFSTLDRIEVVSNAMDLRGFSKHKTRTWYSAKRLQAADYTAIFISSLVLVLTAFASIIINHGRFFNPFI